MNDIIKERDQLKLRLDHLKIEFLDYKDKSQKVIISNEDNYNKVFKENQTLKADIRLNKEKNDNLQLNNIVKKAELEMQSTLRKSNTSKNSNSSLQYQNMPITNETGKMEYLKNIILKYLETIALGNEFQSKILENVIFSVLNVSKLERAILEDKRMKSSFYFSWWYSTKSYLSSKIYGQSMDDTFSANTNKMSNPFTEEREVSKFSMEESKISKGSL
jgi:hypothetical protein